MTPTEPDYWLQRFVSSLPASADIDDVADALASDLNAALQPDYRTTGGTAAMRRGVHVAGYIQGIPHLYHIHMGHEEGPYRKLYVQRHYPDEVPDRRGFLSALETGLVHTRNGYYRDFVQLFDQAKGHIGIRGAHEVRFTIYERLFAEVADIADARGLPGVNKVLSVVAFGRDRVILDRRIPVDGSEDICEWVDAGELLVA